MKCFQQNVIASAEGTRGGRGAYHRAVKIQNIGDKKELKSQAPERIIVK
jgi:hypothetical protein